MAEFLLWSVFVIAVSVAWVTGMVIWHSMEYDKWQQDYDLSKVQWPINANAEVLTGSEVVGYTCVAERRTNRS